jgi:peptidoglycan/LPS O-acetylase OafA/YrhL
MAVKRQDEVCAIESFYIRRFFRIAPLYYLGILVYLSLHLLTQLTEGKSWEFGQYTPFAVLSNIVFVHGFIPHSNNNIVPGGWSIGTEMAFYAMFPILYTCVSKVSAKDLRPIRFIAYAFLCNLIIQLLLDRFTRASLDSNIFVYNNLINQLPVFLLGMLIFTWHRATATALPRRVGVRVVSLLVSLTISIAMPEMTSYTFGFAITPLVWALTFVLLLDLFHATNFDSRVLASIGRVSYSMYVLHFLFAWTATRAILATGIASALSPAATLAGAYVAVVSLTFFMAQLVERVVERNGIALGARVIDRLVNFRSRRLNHEGLHVPRSPKYQEASNGP